MTDHTPTKTARLSEESLAFATVLNAAVDRADRAERLELATRRGRDAAIARAIAAEARAIDAEAENSRLRHAAAEVLSWSLNDMTALLTNPPQNAALFHAQRVLREAMGD
jgi:hypothetical protein